MGAPDPAHERAVDHRDPAERENHSRENATAFREAAHQDPCGNAREFHLEEAVQDFREQRRSWRGFGLDAY